MLSVFLAILTVLYSFPIMVFAIDRTDTPAQITPLVSEDYIIEIPELRSSSAKTFRLPDGNFYLAQYDTDIHIPSTDGKWEDIDNHMSADGNEISTGDARIKFEKKTTGNGSIFTLHDRNRKITLTLDGARKRVEGEITNYTTEHGEDATALEKMTTLDRLNASVLYRDILEDTDLEYRLSGSGIKEYITVKSMSDKYEYSFTMKLNNMYAEENGDGGIYIFDAETDNVVYNIPAPVMWDASDEVSDRVSMTLQTKSNNSYGILITADSEWINAPERVFPVTVDPPIYPNTQSNTVDLSIDSSTPSSTDDSATNYVSNTKSTYWKLTQLPALPLTAYITDAEFSMTLTDDALCLCNVGVYEVLTDWDSALTWNKAFNTSPAQGQRAELFTDYTLVHAHSQSIYTWNITPIVKKWYEGSNYGLTLASVETGITQDIVKFYSSNNNTASVRPKLTVKYIDMKGLEDYWSYTTQDAGFAGVGNVNNATGNLVFSVPTLSTTDFLMPVTPTLVYNFSMEFGDYEYPNAQTANTADFTGKSFKLNINETVIKKRFTDSSGTDIYYMIWADGDGTEHYFMPTATEGIYTDEDGLKLELQEYSGTGGERYCKITDTNDNVRVFSSCTVPAGVEAAWVLTAITDKSGNLVRFELGSHNKPLSIKLKPADREDEITQLRFAYNSVGKLCAIWNPNSGEGAVFRYSNTYAGAIEIGYGNYLRRMVRAHGSVNESDWMALYNSNANTSTSSITVDGVAEYQYNYLGLIASVTNTLSQYKITYGTYATLKVATIKESTTVDDSVGQTIRYTGYGPSSTTLRTSGKDDIYNNADDLVTTFCYDNCGRTVSTYTTDLDGTQIYGASNGQYMGEENPSAKNSLKSSVQTNAHSSNYLLNGGFEQIPTQDNKIPYWESSGDVTHREKGANGERGVACLWLNNLENTSSVSQKVYLDKGEYTLSVMVDIYYAVGVQVFLKAESMTNSAHTKIKEIPVNEYCATGTYVFDALNFTADPSVSGGTEEFKISVVFSRPSGTAEKYVFIDSMMLSRSLGAAEYDMTSLGHFESTGNGAVPSDVWKMFSNESTPITVVDSGIAAFGDVLKIDVDAGQTHFVKQVVYQSTGTDTTVEEAMTFTVSGWAKGTKQSYSDSKNFCIRAIIKYIDSNGNTHEESTDVCFDRGVVDWQFASGGFKTKPSLGTVDSITLMLMYNGHAGVGYFDNISIVQDSSTTNIYAYNNSGFIEEHNIGSVQTVYEYDTNDNVILALSSNGDLYEYTYDELGRLIFEKYSRYTGDYALQRPISIPDSSQDKNRQYVTEYDYNFFGQRIENITYNLPSRSMKMASYTMYEEESEHILGAVISETDSLGNVTRYFYDGSNGRLLAQIDPSGSGVAYTYDGMGNMTEVLPASVPEGSSTYSVQQNATDVSYTYDAATKRLSSITTRAAAGKSTTYYFEYDKFGNTSSTSVGDRQLASYTYNNYNGKLNTLAYGNDLTVKYIYDKLDRISEIQYNTGSGGAFVTRYAYTYDSAGRIYSVTDKSQGEVTMYQYDASGKLLSSYVYDTYNYENKQGTSIWYDGQSRVSSLVHRYDYSTSTVSGSDTTRYNYSYNSTTGNISNVNFHGANVGGDITPTYDAFGRLLQKTVEFSVSSVNSYTQTVLYDYKNTGGFESGLVSSYMSNIVNPNQETASSSVTFYYEYDANGNITEITDANGTVQNKYTYDSMGQLTREDNRARNETVLWTYDHAGNITAKKSYAFTLSATPAGTPVTVNYAYGDSTWSDLLTSYNGKSITYDAIGNPKKVGSAGLTWRGRQLTGLSNWNGAYTDYFYNADGIRIYKYLYNDNNGDLFEHFYTVDGSQILQEKIYESDAMYEHTLVYIYDEAGSPIGYRYREDDYAYADFDAFFFEKNLQGDVIAVYDSDGTKLASYTYDAWGNHTVTYHNGGAVTPARLNPFRYRGYYYDYETGLYYVSSRYYDPEIGRFINADAAIGQIGNVQGTNMFAYCFNNPVNMSDPTGNWPKLSTIFTVVAVAAVAVAAVAVTVATCGAAAPALAVAGGGIIGGISAGAAATAASVATGAMIVAGVSTAAAVTSAVAEKAVEKTAKRNNSVYVLKDDAGTVQYVGRTNNVDKRRAAHSANPARAGLEMEVIASGLNLPESRALEQAGMAYYHTINTANKMNNQINSVSPKYWGAFKELALGTLNYGWNQMSNEILYWTGN